MRRLTTVATVVAVAVVALGVANSQAANAAKAKVTAAGTEFTPAKLKVDVGDTIVWKQKEGTHTVTFKEGGFNQPLDSSNRTVKTTVPAGTYHYFCEFHKAEGMKGKIVAK